MSDEWLADAPDDLDPEENVWLDVQCPVCETVTLLGVNIEGFTVDDLEDREVSVTAIAPPVMHDHDRADDADIEDDAEDDA